MELLNQFLSNFDITRLILLIVTIIASILCITVHELCHGLAAKALGDPTAGRAGRLTLNPLAHIDPLGLLMLVVARVGWAKPVPVDVRYFKRPKRDMALTALAGPASNFILALAASALASGILSFAEGQLAAYVIFFCCYVAVLSVGLGLFNLIPIPPLDGSKLLFSVLPDKLYYSYLRYERYLLLVVVALAWFGFFSGPLDAAMGWVLQGFCRITRFPFVYFTYYFGL